MDSIEVKLLVFVKSTPDSRKELLVLRQDGTILIAEQTITTQEEGLRLVEALLAALAMKSERKDVP